MKAGFAKVRITPPAGTNMMGFAGRDRQHGCEGIHDDIFTRALFIEHGGAEVLIMGFDLCFFGREQANRYIGAIGRKLGLAPGQILLNTSHTHVGPATAIWAFGDYDAPPDPLYLRELEQAILKAASQSRDSMRDVTVWAGSTRSSVPLSRRKPDKDGKVFWAPNPEGVVCDTLPICMFKDTDDKPVCLLFSISCHPSTIGGFEISADYPGVAMDRIDAYLGAECSLFLQGTGGDAKASLIGKGSERWRVGNWSLVAETGKMAANEVILALESGLEQIEPEICAHTIEMGWALAQPFDRDGYKEIMEDKNTSELRRLWAERQVLLLDRGEELSDLASITAHGVKIGKGLRLIGLEGEAVAGLGLIMLNFYKDGFTFPLGYTDGAQLYLPVESMLEEGGYEVVSYYEYGFPAPFVRGFEKVLTDTLKELRERGID